MWWLGFFERLDEGIQLEGQGFPAEELPAIALSSSKDRYKPNEERRPWTYTKSIYIRSGQARCECVWHTEARGSKVARYYSFALCLCL